MSDVWKWRFSCVFKDHRRNCEQGGEGRGVSTSLGDREVDNKVTKDLLNLFQPSIIQLASKTKTKYRLWCPSNSLATHNSLWMTFWLIDWKKIVTEKTIIDANRIANSSVQDLSSIHCTTCYCKPRPICHTRTETRYKRTADIAPEGPAPADLKHSNS